MYVRFFCSQLNHGDVVRTLLAFGSDPRVQNKLGLNAVDAANSHHLREIYIEELLRATASSEYVNFTSYLIYVFLYVG